MSGHMHDFESQWVCEGCGARVGLAEGDRLLSAADVDKLREALEVGSRAAMVGKSKWDLDTAAHRFDAALALLEPKP